MEHRGRLPRREARRVRAGAHLLQRRHDGKELPRAHADSLCAVAGLRYGRALAPLGGMPQTHARDVGEASLPGAALPWPRVGAARRNRSVPDATVPSRHVKSRGTASPTTCRKRLPLLCGGKGGGLRPALSLRAQRSQREILSPHGGCDNRVPPQIWNLWWTSSRLETVGGMWYHTGDFWKGALSPLNGKRLWKRKKKIRLWTRFMLSAMRFPRVLGTTRSAT